MIKPLNEINTINDFICDQIEKRVMIQRIFQNIDLILQEFTILGIRIQISGCLTSNDEKASIKWYLKGRIPLQTLRAPINYSFKTIITKLGVYGIKVWILNNYLL